MKLEKCLRILCYNPVIRSSKLTGKWNGKKILRIFCNEPVKISPRITFLQTDWRLAPRLTWRLFRLTSDVWVLIFVVLLLRTRCFISLVSIRLLCFCFCSRAATNNDHLKDNEVTHVLSTVEADEFLWLIQTLSIIKR